MEKDKVYSFIFQFPAFPRSLYHNIHKLLKAIATMYKHTINKARTPCPKCKKGSFLQGRSLTVHMNQCEVADVKLSDTFDYVEHNKKRCNNDSHITHTLHQRKKSIQKDMNTSHSDGTTKQFTHLYQKPSIHKLVQYSTNPDYSQYVQAEEEIEFNSSTNAQHDNNITMNQDMQYLNNNLPLDSINEYKYQMNYRVKLPPILLYQIDLEHMIRSHRSIDLSLHDKINAVVERHSWYGMNMSESALYSRKALLKVLTKVFNLHESKPTIVRVPVSMNTSHASVAVFNVKARLLSILHDENLMQPQNFAKDYDIFTGKSTVEITHYDEVHTGYLFEMARSHWCKNDPDAFPVPLIAFYDKTHVDVFGSLSCSPFIVWPSFFNMNCRRKKESSRVLGYVPNLGYGKGKSNREPSHVKIQDEHNCLRQITKQLIMINEKGGIATMVMGRKVNLKVWLHIITGDNSGHNDLVGHFNGSGKTNHPYRDCTCRFEDLDDPDPMCVLVTPNYIEEARAVPGGLQSISKKDIKNCLSDVPMADLLHSYLGITPSEMLHVLGSGIFPYMFEVASEIVGENKSKSKEKDALDTLHQMICHVGRRQSEKDFPRTSVRNGLLDGTKKTAKECVGNLLVLLILTYTSKGKALLTPGLRRNNITMTRFQDCIKMMLSFLKWVKGPIKISLMPGAKIMLVKMLKLLKECFPRKTAHGWKIPKFHALAKFLLSIEKFGVASNFEGDTGERFLKAIVKNLAKTTQQRPGSFAEQLAERLYEEHVFQHAYDYGVIPALDYDYVKVQHQDNITLRGKYQMIFGVMDRYGRGSVTIDWHHGDRQKLGIGVSELMKVAIAEFSLENGWTGAFQVTGYTSYKTHLPTSSDMVTFHANEFTHGNEWYDWCMIQFKEEGLADNECICPAMIVGIFKYDTVGIPTPHLIGDLEYSAEYISDEQLKDDTIYVIVHASSDWLPYQKLEQNFICCFKLGELDDSIFIVDVKYIRHALYVQRDFVENNTSRLQYICSLPYCGWGNILTILLKI